MTTSGHQTIEALGPISKSDRLDMPRVLEHDQSRFQRPTDVDPEQNGRSTRVPRSMSMSMLCQCYVNVKISLTLELLHAFELLLRPTLERL